MYRKNRCIIGNANSGLLSTMEKNSISDKIVVIVETDNMIDMASNYVYVNGIAYEEIVYTKSRDFIFKHYDMNSYERKLSDTINILDEYGLIEIKKSTLSKWERSEVVRLFNIKYKKV